MLSTCTSALKNPPLKLNQDKNASEKKTKTSISEPVQPGTVTRIKWLLLTCGSTLRPSGKAKQREEQTGVGVQTCEAERRQVEELLEEQSWRCEKPVKL